MPPSPGALPRRRRPGALRPCGHRGGAAPPSQLRPAVQRLARQVPRRPGAADHRARDRPLSLCRHPLVLDRLRPRRDHHRAADAVARPGAGARRAGASSPRTRRPRPRPSRDAAPGKIMHETRKGEMARARASCRSAATTAASTRRRCSWCWPAPTPSAPATWRSSTSCGRRCWPPWTGSRATATADGDGFVDYARGRDSGLANQGWKDSEDSVFHADGRIPDGPDRAGRGAGLRLCRVPGHGRARRSGAASPRARRAGRRKAERLRARGRGALLDGGAAAPTRIAIDGARPALPGAHLQCRAICCSRACRRRSAAARVARPAAGPRLQLGLGRAHAGARARPRFNPMSYHNGSVWPHDTALCAAGLARYGERDGVARLLSDMFEAAVQFDMRLPELFCGFARRPASRRSPIPSPACRRPGRRARCS